MSNVWDPIVKSLGFKDYAIDAMSDYCDRHSNLIIKISSSTLSSSPMENSLPTSLKIASKLTNLDNILKRNSLILTDKPIQTHHFRIKLPFDIDDLRIPIVDLVVQLESVLCEFVTNEINQMIKGCQKLELYYLANNIRIIEDTDGRYIGLDSDFKVIGNRADKLKRIL